MARRTNTGRASSGPARPIHFLCRIRHRARRSGAQAQSPHFFAGNLPGFPISAIFTFHAFVAPIIRARAGHSGLSSRRVEAEIPVRIASELGCKEFVLVALVQGESCPLAFPALKGSGAVTSFSQADGFVEIDALAMTI